MADDQKNLPVEYQLTARAEKTFSDLNVSVNRLIKAIEAQSSMPVRDVVAHPFGVAAGAANDQMQEAAPEIAKTMAAMQEWIAKQQSEAAKVEKEEKGVFEGDAVAEKLDRIESNTNKSNDYLRDILAELKKEKKGGGGLLETLAALEILPEILPALGIVLTAVAGAATGIAAAIALLSLKGDVDKDAEDWNKKHPSKDQGIWGHHGKIQNLVSGKGWKADASPAPEPEPGQQGSALNFPISANEESYTRQEKSSGTATKAADEYDRVKAKFAETKIDEQGTRIIAHLHSVDDNVKKIADKLTNPATPSTQPSATKNIAGHAEATKVTDTTSGTDLSDQGAGTKASTADPRGVIPYIRESAIKHGVDPNLAVQVFTKEGIKDYTGDKGTSFGATQLHIGGGMGDEWQKKNPDLDIKDPKNEHSMIDFTMAGLADKKGRGWDPYHGSRGVVNDPRQGLDRPIPPPGAAPSATTTASGPVASATPAAGSPGSGPLSSVGSGNQLNPPLTMIRSPSGKTAQVAKDLAPRFQGFINDLEASGYKIKSLGGYADRDNVNSPGKKSFHAFGAAIDINATENPNGGTKTDLPDNAGAIAAKYGLGWGMNFKGTKDPMHFSFGEIDPSSIPAPDATKSAAPGISTPTGATSKPYTGNQAGQTIPIAPKPVSTPTSGTNLNAVSAAATGQPVAKAAAVNQSGNPRSSQTAASALNQSHGTPPVNRVGPTMASAEYLEILFNLKSNNVFA